MRATVLDDVTSAASREPLDIAAGEQAVRMARRAIELALGPAPPQDPAAPFANVELPPLFEEPRGVFTTLKLHPSGALRGCIGFPVPIHPLRAAIPRSAVAAALEDPRFPPLSAPELGRVVIEVSVLTPPEPVRAAPRKELARTIRVGQDGLIVRARGADGLLLPQVAVEQGWDAEEFLAETCEKAGLPRDAWRWPETELLRFESELFAESEPEGSVVPARRVSESGPT